MKKPLRALSPARAIFLVVLSTSAAAAEPSAWLALTRIDALETRARIEVDAQAVERDAADGALRVPLPNGSLVDIDQVVVRVDSGFTHMHGRVETTHGELSAILTRDGERLWGTIPDAEGRVWEIATNASGTVLRKAGGLRAPAGFSEPDVLLPPTRSRKAGASVLGDADVRAVLASADGPVEIDLLGLVSRELARDAATEAEAHGRFRHLVEVSNQTFADSGVPVRLRVVGIEAVEIASLASASQSLRAITNNDTSLGLDVHALRDRLAADLVALIRPYTPTARACGVAWGNGFGLEPEMTDPSYGFSVTHLDPCGPYVMAHEIGHNLGAHHDVETETTPEGRVDRGAYLDSHGERRESAPAFHTVMAYPKGAMTWIGRFSDPSAMRCEGRACGIEGYSNNARTLAMMAPRIAAFRDPPGTLRIEATSIVEGDDAEATVAVTVRHVGPLPSPGLRFTLRTRPGTATDGQDYVGIAPTTIELVDGRSIWSGSLRVRGDRIGEGDETLFIVADFVSDPSRAAVERAITIIDDDPRRRASGRLAFDGAATPTEPVTLDVVVAARDRTRRVPVQAAPPEFRFTVDVPDGARVQIESMAVPAPFAEQRYDFGVLRTDRDTVLTLCSRVRVRGRIAIPAGAAAPTAPLQVNVANLEGPGSQTVLSLQPPDFAFDLQARHGAAPVFTVYSPPAPFFDQQRFTVPVLTADREEMLTLSVGTRISGQLRFESGAQRPATAPRIWLNERSSTTQLGRVIPFDGDRYAVAVRPDAWTWINGAPGPGLAMLFEDFGEVVEPVERDIVIVPAPNVRGGVTIRLVEPRFGERPVLLAVPLDRPAASGGVFAGVTISGGTASSGLDFRLGGSADGESGTTHVFIPLTLIADSASEGVETLSLAFSEPIGMVSGSAEVRVEIRDATDAEALGLVLRPGVAMQRATEGDSGARTIDIPLLISRPAPAGGVRIHVATNYEQGGYGSYAAQPPGDFELQTPVVDIPAGATQGVARWLLKGDRIPEVDEQFSLVLRPEGDVSVEAPEIKVVIANDDEASGLVADRFVVGPGVASEALMLDVLSNDHLTRGVRFLGGTLSVAQVPSRAQVSVDTRGTWDLSDDRIVYRPEAGTVGDVGLSYRVCQTFGAPCQSADVTIRHVPQGLSTLAAATVTSDRGHRDIVVSGLRALPDARFEAHGIVAPIVLSPTLGADATPESPFDAGGAIATLRTIPASASAREWRIFIDARSLSGGDVDVYVGRDGNGNGQADSSEVACTSAMSSVTERCELALFQPANAAAVYWVLLHSRSGEQNVRAELFEVPVDRPSGQRQLAATGPGSIAAGATVPMRLVWNDATLAPGQARGGWLQVKTDANTSFAWVPVRIDRSAGTAVPFALQGDAHLPLSLATGIAHEGLFIDVPPGIRRLDVTTASAANVDLFLARVDAPVASGATPTVPLAPPRSAASASATTPSGNETLSVADPAPGRWYVTPVNASGSTADLTVRATLTGTGPQLRPGGYFNPGRSGNGLFLYPAGSEWAGLWYTYLQDGTATWYYLQAPAPGPTGIWRGTIFRSAWNGSRNHLTPVGEATVTPKSTGAFTFSYTLDGETGSEAYESFGGGCPTFAGAPLDVSGHWFDPAKAGTGYSVQLFPNYEFYLVFGYDAQGVPRYLVAERDGIGAATDTLRLEQNSAACPLCTRTGNPVRRDIGTLTRTIGSGTLQRIQLNGTYTAGVPGTWAANDAVIPLGSLQGCAVN